jgi:putative restriction endonuclease
MTNAVFTASDSSIYDDLIEERYHFPRTYLRQVEAAVGDWIIYYEPRRSTGTTGRQAYFAIAQVGTVVPDNVRPDHFYALMRGYMAFDTPVAFRDATSYRESKLLRVDGHTNKGAFGRAVRELPREEFDDIVRRGISLQAEPWEQMSRVSEEVPEYIVRPIVETVTARKVRDAAFRR